MEMAQDEIVMKRILSIVIFLSCAFALNAQDFSFEWTEVAMDGSRVGATVPTADDPEAALGHIKGTKYIAPNGKKFKGSVAEVAALMLEAQPSMAYVKEIVGYSDHEMAKKHPQSELSNMIADCMIKKTEQVTGKKVDVSFINGGGIRSEIPAGTVVVDDLLSMLPFKNYLCYVSLKGSDLRYIFENFGTKTLFIGGVSLTYKDGNLVNALVGGEPLDDNRLYGVTTVDFLLDGGDGVYVARNAKELIITDVLIYDSFLSFIKDFANEGKNISYHFDDRIILLD